MKGSGSFLGDLEIPDSYPMCMRVCVDVLHLTSPKRPGAITYKGFRGFRVEDFRKKGICVGVPLFIPPTGERQSLRQPC